MRQIALLVNTGSPRTSSVEDVRKFLGEFLLDHHILTMPRLFRQGLVRGCIVPHRSRRSAKRYAYMLSQTRGVMPLPLAMERLAQEVEEQLAIPVIYAPRYGGFRRLEWKRILEEVWGSEEGELIILPAYPQYSYSNAGSAIDYFSHLSPSGKISTRVIAPWGGNSLFIQLLSDQLRYYAPLEDERYHYIASYHSIPMQHTSYDTTRGWDYAGQCRETLLLLMQEMSIPEERWHLSYQSVMGRGRWYGPVVEDLLSDLLESGVRHVVLFSPSFVVECLETIYDLQRVARDFFLAKGGESFIYVPCIGEHLGASKLFSSLIRSKS